MSVLARRLRQFICRHEWSYVRGIGTFRDVKRDRMVSLYPVQRVSCRKCDKIVYLTGKVKSGIATTPCK